MRQFTSASVARFSLAIGRVETVGEKSTKVSAFMDVEVWRKNESASSFELLKKGQMLTVRGYFKPEEWNDQKGKHNRVVMVATEFLATPEKDEAPAEKKSSPKKSKK
ncbi:single-stranded DNA-binding protein [Bacteroides timonensis]|uniref:single-stranded DNA-binding protein n=1 Tax=Bacteroides timonensis TaxID=1470345 RepID=UPI0005C56D1D|nr:single-stranded DNA-binding protein [Bacteroides timonensis]